MRPRSSGSSCSRGSPPTAGGAIKYAAENPDAEIYEIAQAMQGSGAGRRATASELRAVGRAGARTSSTRGAAPAGCTRSARATSSGRAAGATAPPRTTGTTRATAPRRSSGGGCATATASGSSPTSGSSSASRRSCTSTAADGPEGLAAQGIISIDTTGFDVGLPTADIIIQCFLPRWGGAPGAVVEIEDLGALDGDWLIAFNDQDLRPPTEIATLTLQRPRPTEEGARAEDEHRPADRDAPGGGQRPREDRRGRREGAPPERELLLPQARPMHTACSRTSCPPAPRARSSRWASTARSS
jgi:hypothetical protein